MLAPAFGLRYPTIHGTGRHCRVLMQGIGRRLVFSSARAWFGARVEVPRLLRGVSMPHGATCLDIASGLGWGSAALARQDPSARIVALDYDGTVLPRTRDYLTSHGSANARDLARRLEISAAMMQSVISKGQGRTSMRQKANAWHPLDRSPAIPDCQPPLVNHAIVSTG